MARQTYTEVTRQSWGSRLSGSFKGIIFGVILFFIGLWVLFANEGRAVRRAKTLKEGGGAVVSVAADRVDPTNEGRLVHLTGMASTDETLADPTFGVEVNAIHLKRAVQMFQWQEHSESTTEKKVGGSTETTTTYSYDTAWSDRLIDSSGFKIPEGHQNPGNFPYDARSVSASRVSFGAFELSPSLIDRIDRWQSVPIQSLDRLPGNLRWQARLYDDGLYIGRDPGQPAIGDVRVSFAMVPAMTVSIVAQQIGNSFSPFRTSNGGTIELLHQGAASADVMFQAAETSNKVTTWILRLVGFVLILWGISSVLRPLSVLADVLPPVGNLVETGTGIVALMMAMTISVGTIAVAWIFYRPLLGVSLLVLMALLLLWIVRRSRARKGVPAAAPAQPPPPPPPPAVPTSG